MKISPGVKLEELADYECEIEFISERGELKECALLFGPLKTTPYRATLLPGRHTLTSSSSISPISLSSPLSYLYEPDPSILRASLVTTLAAGPMFEWAWRGSAEVPDAPGVPIR